MNQEDIFKKAKEILAENQFKSNHLKTCILANICPKCGEKLIFKSKSRPMPLYDYLLPGMYGDRVCPNCNYKIDYDKWETVIGFDNMSKMNNEQFNRMCGIREA